jgi:hypothetical protein
MSLQHCRADHRVQYLAGSGNHRQSKSQLIKTAKQIGDWPVPPRRITRVPSHSQRGILDPGITYGTRGAVNGNQETQRRHRKRHQKRHAAPKGAEEATVTERRCRETDPGIPSRATPDLPRR